MKTNNSSLRPVLITVCLASVLWFFAFSMPVGNFWIKISISAALLAFCALWLNDTKELKIKFNFRSIMIGLVSAIVLYAIFWIGQTVSHILFSFSRDQITSATDHRTPP